MDICIVGQQTCEFSPRYIFFLNYCNCQCIQSLLLIVQPVNVSNCTEQKTLIQKLLILFLIIVKQFIIQTSFKLKDKNKLEKQSNILYDIPRKRKRLSWQKYGSDQNKKVDKSKSTALARHCHLSRHKFDFNNMKILDTEHVLKTRLIKQMIYVTKEPSPSPSTIDRTLMV